LPDEPVGAFKLPIVAEMFMLNVVPPGAVAVGAEVKLLFPVSVAEKEPALAGVKPSNEETLPSVPDDGMVNEEENDPGLLLIPGEFMEELEKLGTLIPDIVEERVGLFAAKEIRASAACCEAEGPVPNPGLPEKEALLPGLLKLGDEPPDIRLPLVSCVPLEAKGQGSEASHTAA